MTVKTVRNPMQLRELPQAVYAEIERTATKQRRSVNSQILVILDDWATARIQARFDEMPYPESEQAK